VPILPDEDKLSEKHYATLILRLILNRQGRLLSGELVDTTNGFQERFVAWRGLIRVLRTWLISQSHAAASDEQ
jgi:hypothetical protein